MVEEVVEVLSSGAMTAGGFMAGLGGGGNPRSRF
jgi:hypothetical protein